jgi:hypothetical protein
METWSGLYDDYSGDNRSKVAKGEYCAEQGPNTEQGLKVSRNVIGQESPHIVCLAGD